MRPHPNRARLYCATGLNVFAVLVAAPVALGVTDAKATVTISSKATKHMTCSGGVCSPTATNATLNVGDLETLLASGNATVTTTGSGVQATNIDVTEGLSWNSSTALTLDAYQSIAVKQPVAIQGLAGLTIVTNDGGSGGVFSFGAKGNVTFSNPSSSLTINGVAFSLVNSIAGLAQDISADASGSYALAGNYNARGDGTYTAPPVAVTFSGSFEGLGHTISNLAIVDSTDFSVGLFAQIDDATVRDIGLVHAQVAGSESYASVGALAGTQTGGTISGAYSTGSVTAGEQGEVGGLVGSTTNAAAQIIGSHSVAAVTGQAYEFVGGLVGYNLAMIGDSYAGGPVAILVAEPGDDDAAGNESKVSTTGMPPGWHRRSVLTPAAAGGLVGFDEGDSKINRQGSITNCYATGNTTGQKFTNVGGLVGSSYFGPIQTSYSTGKVHGVGTDYVGGLIGWDDESSVSDTYWDMTTSGITNLDQGAGNVANDPGITGLTTTQFQSGLPSGFDATAWAEKAGINGGLPYLLADPPQR
jgi:hypothetical protein